MCPILQCTTVTDRVADHLSATHGLNGDTFYPARIELLNIAKKPYPEPDDFLFIRWNKVRPTLKIIESEPDPYEGRLTARDMWMPVPTWCHPLQLAASLWAQLRLSPEDMFGDAITLPIHIGEEDDQQGEEDEDEEKEDQEEHEEEDDEREMHVQEDEHELEDEQQEQDEKQHTQRQLGGGGGGG